MTSDCQTSLPLLNCPTSFPTGHYFRLVFPSTHGKSRLFDFLHILACCSLSSYDLDLRLALQIERGGEP